ncbi:uncharacterized protein TNCV_4131781 [Trichonephila clavipes]|nr:uncharacterized protein TNCV_4131781 [Trichonephila clavipes]
MSFMHDSVLAHFSIAIRNHFHATHPRRWIGRGKPVAWPPRSPEPNHLDISFLGHLKSLVYEPSVATEEGLMGRIVITLADIARTPDLLEHILQCFFYRYRQFYDLRSPDFELYLWQSLVVDFLRRAGIDCPYCKHAVMNELSHPLV